MSDTEIKNKIKHYLKEEIFIHDFLLPVRLLAILLYIFFIIPRFWFVIKGFLLGSGVISVTGVKINYLIFNVISVAWMFYIAIQTYLLNLFLKNLNREVRWHKLKAFLPIFGSLLIVFLYLILFLFIIYHVPIVEKTFEAINKFSYAPII